MIRSGRARKGLTLVAVCVVILSAGCGGLGGTSSDGPGDEQTGTEAPDGTDVSETADDTETTEDTKTTSADDTETTEDTKTTSADDTETTEDTKTTSADDTETTEDTKTAENTETTTDDGSDSGDANDTSDDEDSTISGDIQFVVDGEEVDFSQEKYQKQDSSFYFEDGSADWNAHSGAITLEYAMGTLPGITVQDGIVTYGGEYYSDNDDDTTVAIMVNGDRVDPKEYTLKDGDDIRIVVHTSG